MNADFIKAYDFSGQSIVITGGAGILGGEMAKALVACGANVAILDFNLPAAQKMAETLSSTPGRRESHRCAGQRAGERLHPGGCRFRNR